MEKLTSAQMGYDLFRIHEHMPEADDFDGTESASEMVDRFPRPGIVYREEDLIKLFAKWGLPKPDFESKEYLEMFNQKK